MTTPLYSHSTSLLPSDEHVRGTSLPGVRNTSLGNEAEKLRSGMGKVAWEVREAREITDRERGVKESTEKREGERGEVQRQQDRGRGGKDSNNKQS